MEFNIASYKPSIDLLKDKVILITGANSGIGRAVSLDYAKHGATVVLLGKNTESLISLYDEIEAKGYPKPAIYPLNLCNATYKDYLTLATNIKSELNRLDGIVFNAATLGQLTPIEQYPLDKWFEVIQVNLNSVFLLAQTCIPLLKETSKQFKIKSSLIFTMDKVSDQGKAYWGAYGISKRALKGFVETLYNELQNNSNIRVNSIYPIPVKTKLRREAFLGENPENLAKAHEITSAYLYLMGSDSDNVNGQWLKPKIISNMDLVI